MLGVFSGEVVEAPAELVTAGSRTPLPKTRAAELVNRFTSRSAQAVSVQNGSLGTLSYSHSNESPFSFRTSFMLGLLDGTFAFVLFDATGSTLFVASDQGGKVPLFWGITSDGYVAFAYDLDLLKGSCGKSLAPFPQGCFYSNALGGLKSYENPKHKVTVVLATEEETCGATFKVEGSAGLTST